MGQNEREHEQEVEALRLQHSSALNKLKREAADLNGEVRSLVMSSIVSLGLYRRWAKPQSLIVVLKARTKRRLVGLRGWMQVGVLRWEADSLRESLAKQTAEKEEVRAMLEQARGAHEDVSQVSQVCGQGHTAAGW